jgi:DnaA family protein
LNTHPFQLPLPISLRQSARLDNFICEDQFLLSSLATVATAPVRSVHFLWGSEGCGKTHLLHAVCRQASENGHRSSYLPLRELINYPVESIAGLDKSAVVCIDDAECLSANDNWQQAIFNLYNRVHDQQGSLLISAQSPPPELGLSLADLVSRFQSGPVFHLARPDDDIKIAALTLNAKERGLTLDEKSARYLLNHYPRDLHALMDLLTKLDQASLVSQRRITIPFIREVLGE